MSVVPRPQVGPAAPWRFPAARTHTLPNGVRLVLIHLPGQHVISSRLAIEAPLTREPRDREGVATIVSRTMDEGTRRRTADEMAETLERGGIALSAGMIGSGMLVDLDATSRRAELGWRLATEFLSQPMFDDGEVGRHVSQRLAEIEQDRAEPGGRAALEWARSFYTDASRGSRPGGGGADTVAAITGADCAAFHARVVRPSHTTVVVAGDLDERETRAALERTFGGWVEEPPAATPDGTSPEYDRVRDDLDDTITFVDRPGAVQTQVYAGSLGPSRHDECGWAPYAVLGYLVGGSPNSRLDAVLREEKGYTYGVHASFRPRSHDGVMSVAGSVRGDATVESVDLMLQILDRVQDGFADDEVRAAVDFIGKTAPGRYATADVVAGEAGALWLDGLDETFVTAYLAHLRELTNDDLMTAWARWKDAPRSIVLVGDAETHVDRLRALGRGRVEVVPADARP